MSAPESHPHRFPANTRRDGWTAERQLRFLAALTRTRSVTKAAKAAGMSREGAYRYRARHAGGLFAAAWDRALNDHIPERIRQVHKGHEDHGPDKLALFRSRRFSLGKVTK